MISCGFDDVALKSVVIADGALTIEQASEFRNALLDAVNSGRDIVVDVSRVANVDLSCLQLVCSLCKSAEHKGGRVDMVEPSDEFASRAASAGFSGRECTVEGRCLLGGGGDD